MPVLYISNCQLYIVTCICSYGFELSRFGPKYYIGDKDGHHGGGVRSSWRVRRRARRVDTICGTCRTLLCSMRGNGITEADRMRSIFLSIMGPREYKLLRSLVAPAKPGDKTFSELVSIMTQHHSPPPSEIVQRYRFHTRFRLQGESRSLLVCRSFGL